jgi:hypothetical protein
MVGSKMAEKQHNGGAGCMPIKAIRDLAALIASFDALAENESTPHRKALADALCHLQLGYDLLRKIHPGEAKPPITFDGAV